MQLYTFSSESFPDCRGDDSVQAEEDEVRVYSPTPCVGLSMDNELGRKGRRDQVREQRVSGEMGLFGHTLINNADSYASWYSAFLLSPTPTQEQPSRPLWRHPPRLPLLCSFRKSGGLDAWTAIVWNTPPFWDTLSAVVCIPARHQCL